MGLSLSTQYLITPDLSSPDHAGCERFLQQLDTALANGTGLMQLRLAPATVQALRDEGTLWPSLLTHVATRCRLTETRLLLNSAMQAESHMADGISFTGLHLTSRDLLACTQRPDGPLIAASCHDRAQLHHAVQLGLDFVTLSPVLPTTSHPHDAALGWSEFALLAAESRIPVFALGGMSRAHLPIAQQHGAHGIAAIRALWQG